MARLRYPRDDLADSDCAPAVNTNKAFQTTTTTPFSLAITVGPQDNNVLAHAFTTPPTDPGTEDPGSVTFTFACLVEFADSPMTYSFHLRMLDASCNIQGPEEDATENPISGTGNKVGTFTFDPSSHQRWQVRIKTKGNGMHGDPSMTFTIQTRGSNTRLIAPDAPGGVRRIMVVS